MKTKLPKHTQRKFRKELNARKYPSEVWMMKLLKSNGIFGYQRNKCLEHRFFGDFVWRKKRLVLEIDGESHNGKEEYDAKRDAFLEKRKWKIIRIKAGNLDQALMAIERIKME